MQRENQKGKNPARTQSGHRSKNSNMHFYKYINNKRRAKENIHSLLNAVGNITGKEKEKASLLPSIFYSQNIYSQGTQAPELED